MQSSTSGGLGEGNSQSWEQSYRVSAPDGEARG